MTANVEQRSWLAGLIGHGVGPSSFVIGRASIAMTRCSTHVVSRCLLHMPITSSLSEMMMVRASTLGRARRAVTSATVGRRSMKSARALFAEPGGGCRIFQAPPLLKTAQHLDFVAYRIREN